MTSPGHLDSPRADAEAPVRHSIWRPRGPVGDAARRSLRIRRFVSALVLLALGTLFYTVVVAPFAHPQLRLAALTTVSPEFDTAPSAALQAVPFAEQDLLAWRQLGEDLSPGHDTHLLLDATTPYLAADLEALGGKLRPLSGGEQDILLLYVRTQGVTRNGEPALRCSPQAAGAPAELYPLSRLLDQLRALPQATKLLIVDAGADAVDFDTGMPVNEFPRLVSDAVAETHDSRLWVLLSHGVLETSQVHWSRQRTAFVEALAHGLTGAADTNVDHVVDLDELFRFVSTSVARSTMEISNGQATQTPQLCWGGGERRRSGTAPVIAPVAMTLSLPEVATADGGAPPTDAKAETADAPSSGQVNPFAAVSQLAPVSVTAPSVSVSSASVTAPTLTLPTSLPTAASLISAAATVAATPPAASTAAPTANAPPPAPATPAPAPVAAAPPKGDAAAPAGDAPDSAPPDAASEVSAQLIRLWELRDRLQARGNVRLTPIDAAPHEWRQLVSELQAFEFRHRSAAIAEPESFVIDLKELADALTRIADRQPRDGRRDPRVQTWLRLESNSALPALPVESIALATALAERGGPAVSEAGTASFSQLKSALQGTDRRAFDEWLKALPPDLAEVSEFSLAATLSTIPDLPWSLLRDSLAARIDAERAAAGWESAPMVRLPTATGDELRLAAEQMLIDGVVDDRMNRAAALLQQARVQYATALADAALLGHARDVWHDASFQAPDYIRWCTATGLATYRCGPGADDIAALLAALGELGRRLQSGAAGDRDAIQIQSGLLEQIMTRIGPAECARRWSARRAPTGAGETPWEIESLLATSLPSAEHRLGLLQSITDLESQRLSSAGADQRGAAVPARSMSPRDWQFLETCTGFQVDVARLAVAGLPNASQLLNKLEQQWESGKSRQSAILAATAVPSDDDLYQIYRDTGVALSRFRRDLSTNLERSVAELNQSDGSVGLATRLELYEAVLQAQRLAAVDASIPLQPVLPLLRLQAAELLAWEAERANAAAVNADGVWVERARQAAAQLRSLSGKLTGAEPLAIDTPAGLTVSAPGQADLMEEQQTIEVSVAGQPAADGRLWIVLEYDPQLLKVDGPPGLSIYRESELSAKYARGAPAQSEDATSSLAGAPLPDADGSFTGTWWTERAVSELAPTWTLHERQQFSFALSIRRLEPATRPARLVIKALTPQHYARSLVQFRTPAPAFVDVQFEGIAGAYARDERGLVLHPFPNCETGYRFKLVNLQPAARVVDVRLLALPQQLDFGIPAGTLSAAEAAAILERVRNAPVAARLDQRPLPPPGAVVGGDPPAEPPPAEPEEENKKPLPSFRYGGILTIVDHTTQETVFIPVRVEPQRPSRYLRPSVSYDLERERVEIVVRGESPDVMPPGGSSVRAEFGEPLDETATFQLDGLLQGPQFETRLFADVQSAPGKVVHLKLHVDGYPRAFLYAIPCDRDATSVPLALDALAVALHRPANGAALRTPLDGIPVRFELDAPLGAFESLPTTAEVGIDLNRDRYLVNEPAVRLQGDRDVDVRLKSMKPDGSLTLVTKISDFELLIPATGLGTMSANVLGRIQVGGAVAWSEPRDIVLDGDAPRIESIELQPGRELGGDQKLRVVVRADDRAESGMASVDLTFDVLRTGEFAPNAKIITAAEVGSVWVADVPLDELAPGTWGLLIRGVDNVGNVSEPRREIVTILSAEAVAAKMLRATEPVVGTVRFGETPLSGIGIALKDDKEQIVAEAKSDAEGRFELPRVKPGTYKLSAQGLVKNKVRTAAAEVVVPPPPAAAEPVKLQLR